MDGLAFSALALPWFSLHKVLAYSQTQLIASLSDVHPERVSLASLLSPTCALIHPKGALSRQPLKFTGILDSTTSNLKARPLTSFTDISADAPAQGSLSPPKPVCSCYDRFGEIP